LKFRHTPAKNIIFTAVVVSLQSVKYWFWRLQLCHFISATKIH